MGTKLALFHGAGSFTPLVCCYAIHTQMFTSEILTGRLVACPEKGGVQP